jgi:small subunit ribosomal protein S15
MAITKTMKKNVVKKFGKTDKDTGRVEVQVALLTKKIDELSKHLKINKKDVHSRRGLIQMISNRRKHMKYLAAKSAKRHGTLVKELNM